MDISETPLSFSILEFDDSEFILTIADFFFLMDVSGLAYFLLGNFHTEIQKRGTTMNCDEGQYHLSHIYEPLLNGNLPKRKSADKS